MLSQFSRRAGRRTYIKIGVYKTHSSNTHAVRPCLLWGRINNVSHTLTVQLHMLLQDAGEHCRKTERKEITKLIFFFKNFWKLIK